MGSCPEGHQFWIEDSSPDFVQVNAAGGPLNDQKGKGLSIAALVLAGVALLLCWVPIVNNVVFFLGLVAVILAIVALIIAIKSQGASRGMAIAALVVGALSMVGVSN